MTRARPACVIMRVDTDGRISLGRVATATGGADAPAVPRIPGYPAPAGGAGGPLASLVDALAIGVLALDSAGRAVYLNPRAATMVARRDGLGLDRDRRLVATDAQARLLLASLIEAVVDAPPGAAAGGFVRLPRRRNCRAYAALVAPGPLVLIHDPDETITAPPATLRAIFGLTMREAELAASLAAGMRIDDFARLSGISRNTVKFHLRAIYLKTNTHTQAGLVATVAAALSGLGGSAFAALWHKGAATSG